MLGFGKQLGIVLKEINMSVTDLSRLTSIPASTLYSIIDRDTKNVGIDKVKKIETALNIIPGDILYNLLFDIDFDVSTRQRDFYHIGDEARLHILFTLYDSLSAIAQVKVLEYLEDLAKIPEYAKKESEDKENSTTPDDPEQQPDQDPDGADQE